MTETMRPQAFEPEMKANAPTPPTPSWQAGLERRVNDGQTLANGLAWFSIGLGLVEIAATERLCEYLGMEEYEDLVRLFGLREIATGIGILSQREPKAWIAGRIAGDLLDLATLATALGPENPNRGRVLGAIGAVAGVTALDILCERQLTSDPS